MRSLVALTLCTQLSGCFFVFIPPGLINKAAGVPAYCVRSGAQVGDKFWFNNQMYEVTEVKGESPSTCRNNPEGARFGVDAKLIAGPPTPKVKEAWE